MASITFALPDITLNPAICPGDLLDLEVGFRNTFNYLLDADETGRNVRDAARDIIRRFLEELKAKGAKPRQALLDFVARTHDLFESATGRITLVRAASAKCLVEMWAERTQIFTPAFQAVFYAIRQLGWYLPRPDLFEYACFQTLVAHPVKPRFAFLWPGLYGLATRDGGKRRSA